MMQQKQIIFIIGVIIIAGSLVYLGYFLGSREKQACQPEEQKVLTPEELGAGDVGETGDTPLITPTMPPAIFSTAGIITEVKSDRLIIRGEGTNFADNVPRIITAFFTDITITFNTNQSINWQGMDGLNQLQEGMRILIGSPENIRGKTEFRVKTINIL